MSAAHLGQSIMDNSGEAKQQQSQEPERGSQGSEKVKAKKAEKSDKKRKKKSRDRSKTRSKTTTASTKSDDTSPDPRISINTGDAKCYSVADLPPEDYLYEDYAPPYMLNKATPSAVKMADINLKHLAKSLPNVASSPEHDIYCDIEVDKMLPLTPEHQKKASFPALRQSKPRANVSPPKPLPSLSGFGALNPEQNMLFSQQTRNPVTPPSTKPYMTDNIQVAGSSPTTENTQSSAQVNKEVQDLNNTSITKASILNVQIEELSASPGTRRKQYSHVNTTKELVSQKEHPKCEQACVTTEDKVKKGPPVAVIRKKKPSVGDPKDDSAIAPVARPPSRSKPLKAAPPLKPIIFRSDVNQTAKDTQEDIPKTAPPTKAIPPPRPPPPDLSKRKLSATAKVGNDTPPTNINGDNDVFDSCDYAVVHKPPKAPTPSLPTPQDSVQSPPVSDPISPLDSQVPIPATRKKSKSPSVSNTEDNPESPHMHYKPVPTPRPVNTSPSLSQQSCSPGIGAPGNDISDMAAEIYVTIAVLKPKRESQIPEEVKTPPSERKLKPLQKMISWGKDIKEKVKRKDKQDIDAPYIGDSYPNPTYGDMEGQTKDETTKDFEPDRKQTTPAIEHTLETSEADDQQFTNQLYEDVALGHRHKDSVEERFNRIKSKRTSYRFALTKPDEASASPADTPPRPHRANRSTSTPNISSSNTSISSNEKQANKGAQFKAKMKETAETMNKKAKSMTKKVKRLSQVFEKKGKFPEISSPSIDSLNSVETLDDGDVNYFRGFSGYFGASPSLDGSERDGSDEEIFSWSDKEDSTDEEEEEDKKSTSKDGGSDDEEQIYQNVHNNLQSPQEEFLDKCHRVAHELMTTEQSYVAKLAILQTTKVQTAEVLDEDIAKKMFPFIDSIYQLHKNNILPYLQERVQMWKGNKRLGDIMKLFAPFLKLYTDYVKNFDEAVKLVEHWHDKSPDFAKMLSTQRGLKPDAASLEYKAMYGDQHMGGSSSLLKIHLTAHMLEPIQRVPRYELLLKQYLKYLPEDSTDRADVEYALQSVSEAARHFENRIKHASKMKAMIELASQIDSPISLVSSARDLVKEGNVWKVNATNGKAVPRRCFLFTDMLLLCKEQDIRMLRVAGIQPRYKVKVILEIEGMQIENGNNLDIPNTFLIKTKKKILELSTNTTEEKADWQQSLWQVVGDHTRKKLAMCDEARRHSGRNSSAPAGGDVPSACVGRQAPQWIHNSQVSMCMLCAVPFTTFKKKRHCRACGRVVCGQCSLHTARLEFDDWREHRVCDECYLILTDSAMRAVLGNTNTHFKSKIRELCRHSGYIYVSRDMCKTWVKRWIEIHEGGVLYSFKAQQDIVPLHSICLAECEVCLCALTDKPDYHIIKLIADTKLYFLRDEDRDRLQGWWGALKTAIEDTGWGAGVLSS